MKIRGWEKVLYFLRVPIFMVPTLTVRSSLGEDFEEYRWLVLAVFLSFWLIVEFTWARRIGVLIRASSTQVPEPPSADVDENIRIYKEKQAERRKNKKWWEFWV